MKRSFLIFLAILTLFSFGHAGAATVTFYTAGPPALANNVAKAFTAKSGIKVETYQATSGDLLARLEAEKSRPRADVVVLASWGEGLTLRRQGMVEPHLSAEAAHMRAGWVDKGMVAQGGAALAVVVNTAQVPVSRQPKSWFDLTSPYWKNSVTMPDPTLSGSAAEFLAVLVETFGDKAWKLFRDLAENGLVVSGPNAAALNPVLSGEKKATLAAVDYVSYGQIAKGERLAILYPAEGTAVALRPVLVQKGAPHLEEARQLVDFLLSKEGQVPVAKAFLIPGHAGIRAERPLPGDFRMLTPNWDFLEKNQAQIVGRFRQEIVEQIIQKR